MPVPDSAATSNTYGWIAGVGSTTGDSESDSDSSSSLIHAWLEHLGWTPPVRDECEDTSAALVAAAIAQLELAFGMLSNAQKELVEETLSCGPGPASASASPAAASTFGPVFATSEDAAGIHACVLAIEEEFHAWANFCAVVAAAASAPRCPPFAEARAMVTAQLLAFVNHLPKPLPHTIARGCSTARGGGGGGVGASSMELLVRAHVGGGEGGGVRAFGEVFAHKASVGAAFGGGSVNDGALGGGGGGFGGGGGGGGGGSSANDGAASSPPAPTPVPALPTYRGEWQWLDQGSGSQVWSASTSWEAGSDVATSESFTHGLEQSVSASAGVDFFGAGVEIEASAGASQEWSASCERTISQVRGGEETAACGSPVCEGGNLHRWAVRRYVAGALTQELKTCSFVCIRNSLNRLAKPKCPTGWCGQDPTGTPGSTGTGDCQCCNGIEWAADTTNPSARDLTCPGATDANGQLYPWMPAVSSVSVVPAPVAASTVALSTLLNGATCLFCD